MTTMIEMTGRTDRTRRTGRTDRAGHVALFLAALLLAACGGGAEGAPGGEAAAAGGGMPPMPVDVDTARRGQVVDAVRANGRIEAMQSIELRPDEQGRITQLLFREGQYVTAGTPLVKIDDAMLRAQAAKAEADRDLAKQKFDRLTRLRTDDAAPPADYDEAAAGARAAEATLAALQLQIERTTVRAPFAGVVGQRFVSLGDYVTSSSRLLTLQTTDPQRVAIDIPERYAQELRPGQTVEFAVASQPGKAFKATVEFVDPVVQEEGRTILVKARAANPGGILKAGMFVEARLAVATRSGAVVVPEDAVQPLRTSNVIWAVVDGKAARRTVTLGSRTAGMVEVLTGVSAGEQVVVGGLERMSEGMPVAPRMRGAAMQQQSESGAKP